MMDIGSIENHAKNMRKHILDMGYHAGNHAAHMGGALSLVDILAVLYFDIMNIREVGVKSEERDRCILSKGHGSLGYYSALIEAGFIDEKYKDTFEDDYSALLGHPYMNRDLGIEFTNGSLGMGLSIGAGVALALKKKQQNNSVFVLLGDGECNEGSCWEAFMAAPHYGLDNLVAVVDCNGFQLSGSNDDVMPVGDMADKLKAFGWNVVSCDGHDYQALHDAFSKRGENGKPLAVVAHTVKGKGFSFSEGTNAWHHAIVLQKHYEQGLQELDLEIEK